MRQAHRRVVTTRREDEDIDDAIAHYAEAAASDAAGRFVDELERTTNLLAEHPSIGSPRLAIETNIPQLRSLPVRQFPYLLVYTDDPDAVRVHRVVHTSRDVLAELMSEI